MIQLDEIILKVKSSLLVSWILLTFLKFVVFRKNISLNAHLYYDIPLCQQFALN